MISNKIRLLREQKGYTQTELAKQLGITRSGVNAWEMGISVPSTQYVVELAKIFNVSCDFLLGVDATSTINVSKLSDSDILIVCQLINYLRKKNTDSDDEF